MLRSLFPDNKDVFHVAIPRFHMLCPPFREPALHSVSCPPTLGDESAAGVMVFSSSVQSSYTSRYDDDRDEGDGSGEFNGLRGINMAALEGAWCPRHI